MPQLCFYLHLHQPHRLKDVNIFDVGQPSQDYFSGSEELNKKVFQKVAHKSYIPMLSLIKVLLDRHANFKCAFSISGVFLEQAQQFEPKVIKLLKELVNTGKVELIGETYYHSLASLYSETEFKIQVYRHTQLLQELFEYTPQVFRNTELIYSNDIARQIEKLPFRGILTEAVTRYLGDRPKTLSYFSKTKWHLPLLLKHAELSDDIAFRFSDKNWPMHPLSAEKYLEWVEIYPENHTVNLFMDFETFGEHQWADTGIFKFWEAFVEKFLEHSWNRFVTPIELVEQAEQEKLADNGQVPDWRIYDVPEPISWADVDRDVTAWRDNVLQQDTLKIIYDLEAEIIRRQDKKLLEDWRNLQTSDHFYYMCTKWSADGDVHAYFSPYDSPYEAYRRYSIVLADLQERMMS
jgi:alpha-amylase